MSKHKRHCEHCGGETYKCSDGLVGGDFFADYCCIDCGRLTIVRARKPKDWERYMTGKDMK